MNVPRRKTGFFTRVKQAFTCADSPEVAAQRSQLDQAIADLKGQVAAGKITQLELEQRVRKLQNGNGHAPA